VGHGALDRRIDDALRAGQGGARLRFRHLPVQDGQGRVRLQRDHRGVRGVGDGRVSLVGGHGGRGDVPADDHVELGPRPRPLAFHRGRVVLGLVQARSACRTSRRETSPLRNERSARARRDLGQLARDLQPPLGSGPAEEREVDVGPSASVWASSLRPCAPWPRPGDAVPTLPPSSMSWATLIARGQLIGVLVARFRIGPLACDFDAGLVHRAAQAGGGDGGVRPGEGQRVFQSDGRGLRVCGRGNGGRGGRLPGGQPGPKK
jgi:hypothetical protein